MGGTPTARHDSMNGCARRLSTCPRITRAMVSQLIPGPTHDRSRTIQTHVIAKDASEKERAATLERADFLEWVVNEEDYKTGLGIQSALASGANTEFVFGRNEPGNQMFHRWVDELIASTPVADPKKRET